MKRFLLASTVLLASPALATEYVTDTTFDNSANLSVVSGCAYGTGELIATAVLGRCAYKNVVAVHKGDHIKYTVTIRNYASGSLQVLAVAPPATASGANVPVTDGTNGAIAIPDNFPTTSGLIAPETHPADDSTEAVGAFRFSCSGMPKFIADDPMVYPGKPGASHPHMEVGNMGFNANSTERSLRTSGTSNCGSRRYPVMRNAYWMPAAENGDGDLVPPYFQNFYYKVLPASNAACGFPDATHIGYCIPLPRSLRYLSGFNMATMSGGPTNGDPLGDAGNLVYECRQRGDQSTRNATANGSYTTIAAVVAAGCPAGDILYIAMNGMSCWNGTQVDSADHRTHMAWPTGGNVSVSWTSLGVAQIPESTRACPTTHPYKIPTFAWQAYFVTDASFAAGKWHLSSDDGMGMAAGTTLHMDYWASWSPAWQDMWHQHCINEHRTCSGGTDGVNYSFGGTPGTTGDHAKVQVVSITTLGRSRRLHANGTYTGEIIAAGDGQISLYSPDGLTAKIDDWRMDTVTKVNKATGTTHHTTH